MSDRPLDLPDAHWGDATTPLPDWREVLIDDEPDDDDEPAETPADVIEQLGFDPMEPDEDAPAEDAAFVESDHPRDRSGKFGSGGGGGGSSSASAQGGSEETPRVAQKAIKDIPPPGKQSGSAPQRLLAITRKGLEDGDDPQAIADKLKEVAGRYAHPVHERYANQLIDHLEKAHGLKPGALGKAKRRIDEPRAEPKPPPKAIPPAKPQPKPEAKPAPAAKGAKPQSIADVLAQRTDWKPAETERHAKAWEHATPEFLAAMQRVKPLRAVIDLLPNQLSHYRSGEHMIGMAPKYNDATVWRHEFGHAMDYNGKLTPTSYAAEGDRQEEAERLIRAVAKAQLNPFPSATVLTADLAKAAEQHGLTLDDLVEFTARGGMMSKARVVDTLAGRADGLPWATRAGAPSMEQAMYADFLGAMSGNVVGGGHAMDYYRLVPSRHCSEMFANYVSLVNGPGGKVYKALLHTIAPKSCRAFDEIIRDRANG